MFGIEFIEISLFLRQLGLALAGAAALWGIVFWMKSRKEEDLEKKHVFYRISEKLIIPFVIGFTLSVLAWLILLFGIPALALAHEGIALLPETGETKAALSLMLPVFLIFVLVAVLGLLLFILKNSWFLRRIGSFYVVEFLLATILISFSYWTGGFGKEQLFFIGHSAHSIFTLGTVIILDSMFLFTKKLDSFKRCVYPIFPLISKVIWVGLGFDFLSVALIFPEVIVFTPKFFFMQTVTAIVIMNGAFLSGPVTKKFISLLKSKKVLSLTPGWNRAFTFAGSLSVGSWVTNTFVDFLNGITLGYTQLLGLYALFIGALYVVYKTIDHYRI